MQTQRHQAYWALESPNLIAENIEEAHKLELDNGSKVAVIGGGPAGAFFSYFLIDLAKRADLEVQVDIFEPRDFFQSGPRGCNMCAGIISESLVQTLATEGINLPSVVVQRGIDSYVLHTSTGKTKIKTVVEEKRIAAVYRGAGPRDIAKSKWKSFDGHLLELAVGQGAFHKKEKVAGVHWHEGRPEIKMPGGAQIYDLAVFATGVNPTNLKMIEELGLKYRPPKTARSHVREFFLGQDQVNEYLGNNVHIFLLPMPRLEYAAIIPKGDYATLCLIGDGVDGDLIQSFLATREVRECLPKGITPKGSCRCSPYINMKAAVEPFADRVVFIGDCGVTRLFKDGIGAAYKTAKAAAVTAVFQGISARDWRRNFLPTYKLIENDNKIGRVVFAVNGFIKKRRHVLGGLLRMVKGEQQRPGSPQRMSGVLWDTFTGSAMYRDIFKRTIHPLFLLRFLLDTIREISPMGRKQANESD